MSRDRGLDDNKPKNNDGPIQTLRKNNPERGFTTAQRQLAKDDHVVMAQKAGWFRKEHFFDGTSLT